MKYSDLHSKIMTQTTICMKVLVGVGIHIQKIALLGIV